jgi:hypothetical protein
MMKLLKHIAATLAFASIVGFGPAGFFADLFSPDVTIPENEAGWFNHEMAAINSQASNIDQNVLKLCLLAYQNARLKGLDRKQLLTIIDYSKPSSERRLWVVDLKTSKVLFNTWVSHGKNSGEVMATSFSNEPGSLKSSLGVFLTETPYTGGNGYSLRLMGLEPGFNDNAQRRSIVVHGAWYVSPDVIRDYGQLGRSWGCPAVKPDTIGPLINAIKNNTLVVMYYPDRNWLHHSTFLSAG